MKGFGACSRVIVVALVSTAGVGLHMAAVFGAPWWKETQLIEYSTDASDAENTRVTTEVSGWVSPWGGCMPTLQTKKLSGGETQVESFNGWCRGISEQFFLDTFHAKRQQRPQPQGFPDSAFGSARAFSVLAVIFGTIALVFLTWAFLIGNSTLIPALGGFFTEILMPSQLFMFFALLAAVAGFGAVSLLQQSAYFTYMAASIWTRYLDPNLVTSSIMTITYSPGQTMMNSGSIALALAGFLTLLLPSDIAGLTVTNSKTTGASNSTPLLGSA